jgi:uncharacterized membrane protein
VQLPVGTILLIIVAILVYFGLLHRVFDRMRMNDTTALVIVLLMAAGTFLDLPLSRGAIPVTVNVGGALIPLIVAVWLTVTAEEASEKWRAIFAALTTGAVVWGLTKVLNPDEQFMRWSPMIAFGIAAGIIAALAGRSRRAAFIGGIGGLLVADIIHWIELAIKGIPGSVAFGGAGTFDATVIAAIISVGIVEITGEAREKAVKPAGEGRRDETKE